MRGLLNVLTRERDLSRYGEALFIATGPAGLVDKIIRQARADFPNLRTTYLAPRSFLSQIQFPGEVLLFEDLKKDNLGSLLRIRKRKFDICMFIGGARGSFQRAKLAAFAVNASRVLVYDRTGLYTPIDRSGLRKGLPRVICGLRATFSRRSQPTTYETRVAREKELFTELHTRSREDLTEASNPALEYLLEKVQRKIQQQTGRNAWEHLIAEVNRRPGCQLLSLGSGPGGAEMNMARQFTVEYCFTCMDLNPDLMKLGERHSKQLGLNFRFLAADINKISLQPRSYDIVFAHAALHHFLALEHIFDQVNKSLKPGGKFIAYEVIPRNGMRLWDEANEVVQKLWQTLPDRLKYNRASSTPEFCPDYPNRAYGEESFECIRSEEIYPLLKKNFQIHVEVPALAFARRFVDTEFGPNYDLSDPQDRQIIDQLFELDESYLSCKQLKPETIFLVMGNEKTS